jgi:hypothetical protein
VIPTIFHGTFPAPSLESPGKVYSGPELFQLLGGSGAQGFKQDPGPYHSGNPGCHGGFKKQENRLEV